MDSVDEVSGNYVFDGHGKGVELESIKDDLDQEHLTRDNFKILRTLEWLDREELQDKFRVYCSSCKKE